MIGPHITRQIEVEPRGGGRGQPLSCSSPTAEKDLACTGVSGLDKEVHK